MKREAIDFLKSEGYTDERMLNYVRTYIKYNFIVNKDFDGYSFNFDINNRHENFEYSLILALISLRISEEEIEAMSIKEGVTYIYLFQD